VKSLAGHFARWLGLGALACVLAALAVEGGRRWSELASTQDRRLSAAASGERELAPSWRITRADGETSSGGAVLPRYPWPVELRPQDGPRLYYTHSGGTLLRAAAAARPGPNGQMVIVQVAEPASARVPGWAELRSSALAAFLAGVLLMGALAAIAAVAARRWIVRSAQAFEHQGAEPAPAPAELEPTLARMRALLDEQGRWVDEQRRFLADAAHQLRTPMAVLRTQLQSALTTHADPAPLLSDMLHTVDRATGLANQLLSLTRVEQLKRAGRLEQVAVDAAVRDAVVELSPLVAQKRLDFALEGEAFQAPADAVMLGEVLRNLLANAIHHSPRGGRIGVALRGAAPLQEVVVWDEGPGIDDEVKPRLFTPFSAAKGGVGLGLSICQQIAQAMGAEVQLHNRIDGDRVAGVDAVLAWRLADAARA
jgi:two-component system sensor histidine kinase TctE